MPTWQRSTCRHTKNVKIHWNYDRIISVSLSFLMSYIFICFNIKIKLQTNFKSFRIVFESSKFEIMHYLSPSWHSSLPVTHPGNFHRLSFRKLVRCGKGNYWGPTFFKFRLNEKRDLKKDRNSHGSAVRKTELQT